MTPFVPLVAMVELVVIPVVTDSNSCLGKPSLAQVPTKAVRINKVRVRRGGLGLTCSLVLLSATLHVLGFISLCWPVTRLSSVPSALL